MKYDDGVYHPDDWQQMTPVSVLVQIYGEGRQVDFRKFPRRGIDPQIARIFADQEDLDLIVAGTVWPYKRREDAPRAGTKLCRRR
jgi:hypothetical protein